MKANILVAGLAFVALTACAPTVRRGVVAMKISGSDAHVCLGNQEGHVGDEVSLYRNVCNRDFASAKSQTLSCEYKSVGKGKITELLNEHYSVVRFPNDVEFKEGDVVEVKG